MEDSCIINQLEVVRVFVSFPVSTFSSAGDPGQARIRLLFPGSPV